MKSIKKNINKDKMPFFTYLGNRLRNFIADKYLDLFEYAEKFNQSRMGILKLQAMQTRF